jgi:AraC family transcriptional regulator
MMTTTRLETMEVEVPPTLAVQLPVTCETDTIAEAMPKAFATLGAFMGHNGLTPAGPPRTIYTEWAPAVRFTLAFPIAAAPPILQSPEGITISTVAGGRALRFVHHGPYDSIRETYGQIDAWLRERGAIEKDSDWARYKGMWEEYVNEPGKVPDSELVTYIYLPLRTF